MDTVEDRQVLFGKMLRYRFIRRKHERFDQTFTDTSFSKQDIDWHPLRIDFDFCFASIKVDGSSLFSSFFENVMQVFHLFKHIHDFRVFLSAMSILIHKNLIDRFIRHPVMRVDNTGRYRIVYN